MDERARQKQAPRLPVFLLPPALPSFLFFSLSLLSLHSPALGAGVNASEIVTEMAWDLIGIIGRIRRYQTEGAVESGTEADQSSPMLLRDPHFLYATLYRF